MSCGLPVSVSAAGISNRQLWIHPFCQSVHVECLVHCQSLSLYGWLTLAAFTTMLTMTHDDSSRANDHERQTCLDRGPDDPLETFDLALSEPDIPVGEAALRKSKRSMSGSTLTSAANKRSCAAALLGLRAGRADCATIADNAPSGKHAANSERYLSPHGQGRTRHARS